MQWRKINCQKIKKDYQAKNLSNPFLRQRYEAKKRRLHKFLWPAWLLFFVFIIWFVVAAPFWRIKKINLIGLSRVSVVEIEDAIWDLAVGRRWWFFPADNILFFDAKQAATDIMSAHDLSACYIKKRWPSTIEVIGQERPYAFIWQEGSDLYYAAADGYIIRGQEVSEEDKNKYFILENRNPRSLINSQNRLSVKEGYLEFSKEIHDLVLQEPELILERLILDWEFNTLKVKFEDGPLVYFNTQDRAPDQLDRLLLVKKEKIKDNFSKTDYIDLRYGDRIFINPNF